MTRETIIITAGSFASSNVFGGHYRSASAIGQLLSRDYDVLLVNVGNQPSPVMRVAGQETLFLKGNTVAPWRVRRLLKRLMCEHKVKAVVAFDQKIGELFRPLARRLRVGFILVKPGGGQPRLYYPKATHQIVFMEADRLWVKGVNVQIAAGRIFPPEQDLKAQKELSQHIGLRDEDLTFLRIGRIDEHYAAVNRAAFKLSAFLREHGLPARTILLGAAESAEEVKNLERVKGVNDAIVTDPRFTDQASRLLSLFRYNIGTGRGFMEGCNVGQVMFCATQVEAHDLPLLVTDKNFNLFFDQNFSPRIKPGTTPEANAALILETMRDSIRQKVLSEYAEVWFEENFSAETSRRIYVEMIKAAVSAPEKFNVDHLRSELHLRCSVLLDRVRTFVYRYVVKGRRKT